jgi:hypothetical protein
VINTIKIAVVKNTIGRVVIDSELSRQLPMAAMYLYSMQQEKGAVK